jgi:hypothetical protein
MMFRMNAVFCITFSLLLLVGIGTTLVGIGAVAAQYGAWLEVCRPVPYESDPANDYGRYRGWRPESYNMSGCAAGQYPGRSSSRVAMTLCRPLPPASGAEAVEFIRVALEDLRACPAGKFPMRYGFGDPEGISGGLLSCVPLTPEAAARRWDWSSLKYPIVTPQMASIWATSIASGSPCPPNMAVQWRGDSGPNVPGYPRWN